MVVMTAKVDKKKLLVVIGVLALVIVLLVALFRSSGKKTGAIETNADRIAFLQSCGWQVSDSPIQTQQVLIPTDSSDVFARYNALQQSQGYDLTKYAGKEATRYVYTVTNMDNATGPVYATLLIRDGMIIGGDVTDTGDKGVIQGLKRSAG